MEGKLATLAGTIGAHSNERCQPSSALNGSLARTSDLFRCVLPRSQTRVSEFRGHLGSAVRFPTLGRRGHFLFNGSAQRAGLLNFDTSPELGGNERRVGANAFHAPEGRSAYVQVVVSGVQARGN